MQPSKICINNPQIVTITCATIIPNNNFGVLRQYTSRCVHLYNSVTSHALLSKIEAIFNILKKYILATNQLSGCFSNEN